MAGRHSMCTEPEVFWKPDITIGDFTTIGMPARFFGSANHPWPQHRSLVSNYPFNDIPFGTGNHIDYPCCGGDNRIVIGNDVWTGYGCTFLGGITIGDGAIIGAEAVVAKDIPPYAVAVGNPCTVKHFRFSQDIIDKLERIQWWLWSDEEIIQRMPDFLDVQKFVEKYG